MTPWRPRGWGTGKAICYDKSFEQLGKARGQWSPGMSGVWHRRGSAAAARGFRPLSAAEAVTSTANVGVSEDVLVLPALQKP